MLALSGDGSGRSIIRPIELRRNDFGPTGQEERVLRETLSDNMEVCILFGSRWLICLALGDAKTCGAMSAGIPHGRGVTPKLLTRMMVPQTNFIFSTSFTILKTSCGVGGFCFCLDWQPRKKFRTQHHGHQQAFGISLDALWWLAQWTRFLCAVMLDTIVGPDYSLVFF